MLRQTLAAVDGPQLVAGDFNAARDHRPFRELLVAGGGLRGRQPEPVLARVHVAGRRPGATCHAPGSRAGFPDGHRADDPGQTESPAPTIVVSWPPSSSHRKPDRYLRRAVTATPRRPRQASPPAGGVAPGWSFPSHRLAEPMIHTRFRLGSYSEEHAY